MKIKLISVIALFLTVILALSSCSASAIKSTDEEAHVVGTCGDHEVRFEELRYLTLHYKADLMAKYGEFKEKYFSKHPSCHCLDLIGYNVTTPEGFQRAIDSGDMMNICPKLVQEVIEILDEIME